jgi:Zn-dependent peptidase ImmA (M78 family)
MPTFERGFKAWCERTAVATRLELQLEPRAPLGARALAQHLGVELITPHDLSELSESDLRQLMHTDRIGWSAVSFTIDDRTTVIYNSTNSRGRQSSDIMHEIAHILRQHEPTQIILSDTTPFAMRSFDSKQEDEANWLGWTLLLPRPALEHCADLDLSVDQIAERYEVSEQLVNFRRRMTGIERQRRQRTKLRRART